MGYLFNQPALEALLDREARSLPHVQVAQSCEATVLMQHPDQVELTLCHGTLETGKWTPDGETQTVRARYVIGADGANSFVRQAIGVPFDDLGFQEDWLVIDLKPNAGVTLDVPDIDQWCNPARPTTMVPGGPGYRRWEFMRLPHETLEGLQKTEKVWELLAPWVSPFRRDADPQRGVNVPLADRPDTAPGSRTACGRSGTSGQGCCPAAAVILAGCSRNMMRREKRNRFITATGSRRRSSAMPCVGTSGSSSACATSKSYGSSAE